MENLQRTVYITTYDNPYDPQTEWRQWYMYDMLAGYSSCCYLDRVTYCSYQMTDEEYVAEIERGIDEIIRFNPTIYKKIVRYLPDETNVAI